MTGSLPHLGILPPAPSAALSATDCVDVGTAGKPYMIMMERRLQLFPSVRRSPVLVRRVYDMYKELVCPQVVLLVVVLLVVVLLLIVHPIFVPLCIL